VFCWDYPILSSWFQMIKFPKEIYHQSLINKERQFPVDMQAMRNTRCLLCITAVLRTLHKTFFVFLSFILFSSFPNPQAVRGQIIFFDNFDFAQLESRWALPESQTIRVNYDVRYAHSGACSMEAIALPGEDAGGMARIWFMPGYDKVHVRWYCRFCPDFDQGNLMHLNKLTATCWEDRWAATAGKRPSGFDFFRTTLDIWRDWGRNPAPGEPVFYSYFPLMKINRKTGKYWGNLFKPKRKILIRRGRWYCMEMMLKANVAGFSNGEQAFWINGKLIGHFKNITWRYTDDLKINSFSLGLYIHSNKNINRIWYDDVVVSTDFIGL
jgi:hypothetical protein